MSSLQTPFAMAPIFLVLYGVAHMIDGLDGNYGPGIAWTLGHIMFLSGMLTFALVLVGLHRRIGQDTAKHKLIAGLALVCGLIGLSVFVRVIIIDIITGLRAGDHADMASISARLNAYPSAGLERYYNVGPLLFQLGMLTLMIQMVVLHRLPWWGPVLLLAGFLLLGFNLNLLVPGALLIGCALMPLTAGKYKVRSNPAG